MHTRHICTMQIYTFSSSHACLGHEWPCNFCLTALPHWAVFTISKIYFFKTSPPLLPPLFSSCPSFDHYPFFTYLCWRCGTPATKELESNSVSFLRWARVHDVGVSAKWGSSAPTFQSVLYNFGQECEAAVKLSWSQVTFQTCWSKCHKAERRTIKGNEDILTL